MKACTQASPALSHGRRPQSPGRVCLEKVLVTLSRTLRNPPGLHQLGSADGMRQHEAGRVCLRTPAPSALCHTPGPCGRPSAVLCCAVAESLTSPTAGQASLMPGLCWHRCCLRTFGRRNGLISILRAKKEFVSSYWVTHTLQWDYLSLDLPL